MEVVLLGARCGRYKKSIRRLIYDNPRMVQDGSIQHRPKWLREMELKAGNRRAGLRDSELVAKLNASTAWVAESKFKADWAAAEARNATEKAGKAEQAQKVSSREQNEKTAEKNQKATDSAEKQQKAAAALSERQQKMAWMALNLTTGTRPHNLTNCVINKKTGKCKRPKFFWYNNVKCSWKKRPECLSDTGNITVNGRNITGGFYCTGGIPKGGGMVIVVLLLLFFLVALCGVYYYMQRQAAMHDQIEQAKREEAESHGASPPRASREQGSHGAAGSHAGSTSHSHAGGH